MSINDLTEKVKSWVKPFYTLILMVLVGSLFFALGRLSALEDRKTPIKITFPNNEQTGAVVNSVATGAAEANSEQSTVQTNEQVIGSKSGKKYYYPWCGTVKMIKPENQVKFASIGAAREAGYLPASNCKGLK
jgi:hypothetical protein